MNEPRSSLERVDLSRADDPRDVVHKTVAVLAQGGCVAVAGRSGVNLVTSALHENAVGVFDGFLADGDGTDHATLLIRGAEEASDWVPGLGTLGRRLARRVWPGAVTLEFPDAARGGLADRLPEKAQGVLSRNGALPIAVPADPFLRDTLRLLPGPLLSKTVAPSAGVDAALMERLASDCACKVLVESGGSGTSHGVSRIRVADGSWELVQPGELDEDAVARMAATVLLFICTGNTCRSPMAEALCKCLLAARLGCVAEDLVARGYVVRSAGIAAAPGMPAAPHAVEVVRARGGTLTEHSSSKLTLELVRQADYLVAMTGDHLETLLDHVPDAADRSFLLHPDGADVADPVGSDLATYQRTADAIESYLERLLDAIGVRPS